MIADGGGKRCYLARITGAHPVYKLNREFCEPISKEGRWRTFQVSEDGVYEEVTYTAKGNGYREFFRLENGNCCPMTEADVMALFDAPAKGQAPRWSACSCTDGCCDDGCRCGSECNCKGGPIWDC